VTLPSSSTPGKAKTFIAILDIVWKLLPKLLVVLLPISAKLIVIIGGKPVIPTPPEILPLFLGF